MWHIHCILLLLSLVNSIESGFQGWGEYYSGTRLAQNDKHEYTKNIVLEYYSSTDFPLLVLVCSVLAPALVGSIAPYVLSDNFESLDLLQCILRFQTLQISNCPRESPYFGGKLTLRFTWKTLIIFLKNKTHLIWSDYKISIANQFLLRNDEKKRIVWCYIIIFVACDYTFSFSEAVCHCDPVFLKLTQLLL